MKSEMVKWLEDQFGKQMKPGEVMDLQEKIRDLRYELAKNEQILMRQQTIALQYHAAMLGANYK